MQVPVNHRYRSRTLAAAAVLALATPLAGFSAAHAGNGDRDGDGMPNRWEKRHGLRPLVADARADKDKDGLANVAEFRLRTDPVDEDTDDDGHDDRDEVRDGVRATDVTDDDSDDDGIEDGDEDADRDGVDNEDEDDASERCRFDDDDLDVDHVDDEDENELELEEGDNDSDDDGIEDGDEDADENGESNEDADDVLEDSCDREDGEDADDLFGTIVGYDASSAVLTMDSRTVGVVWFKVTEDTEIEVEGSDEDGSTADLVAGALVLEIDVDDETGALEGIELGGSGEGNDEL